MDAMAKPDTLSLEEIQSEYDTRADGYERGLWFDHYVLGVKRQRKRLMSKAQGSILDVACGTGLNFPMFPPTSRITAIDLSPQMLEIARQKAVDLNLKIQTQVMDAEKLEFAEGSFDTVTSALSTCTFPDPVQALREMGRVCRPGGQILLLEHGHSNIRWLAAYQDRHAQQHFQANAGCRWNQDPLDLVNSAGLKVREEKRFGLGIFHAIVAAP